MENFKNLEKLIQKFQRGLRNWAMISVVTNFLVILIASYMNFFNSKDIKLSSFEACYQGIQSIVNNAPDKSLLNDSIIEDLRKSKLEFDYIGLIKLLDNYQCDVFIKSKNRTRRFLVKLEKSINYSKFYKVLDIKETKLNKEYQIL